MKNSKQHVAIFTDGSSRGNPGPGGWAAIVVAGEILRELGGREAHTTNNRMELSAAMEALRSLDTKSVESVQVFTDSRYLINGVTKWISGWKRKGWKTMQKKDVENRDLWEGIDEAVQNIEKEAEVKWNYVPGHSDIPANERCDEIATAFADGASIALYDGPASKYSVDTKKIVLGEGDELSIEEAAARKASKERSKIKAYSYLSVVNGIAKKHATWLECEARVKGARGAKYKKAISAEDEKAILKDWSVSLS